MIAFRWGFPEVEEHVKLFSRTLYREKQNASRRRINGQNRVNECINISHLTLM